MLRHISCIVLLASCLAGHVHSESIPLQSESIQRHTQVTVKGGSIEILFESDELWQRREIITSWIETSANTIATYFGEFPVKNTYIALIAVEGKEVKNGVVFGGEEPIMNINIGKEVGLAELESDWIMVHEMAHLAFPDVKQSWAEEGMATYFEPIARANAGDYSADYVWQSLMKKMPLGQPRSADKGLNNTPTWGRKYWGGAIFYLTADVEIRRRTDNKFSLKDAFKGLLREGYNMNTTAELKTVFAAADKSVGVPVLTELYNRHKDSAVPFDLDKLWRDLGVTMNGDTVQYDDSALLSSIRKNIIP